MLLPHQIVEQSLQNHFDRNVRQHYFRGMKADVGSVKLR